MTKNRKPEIRKCEDCGRPVNHYKTPDGGYGYTLKCERCLCPFCAEARECGGYCCAEHYDEAEDNANSIAQTGRGIDASNCPSWGHFVNLYRVVYGSNDDLDKPFIRNMRENDLQNAIINMTALNNAPKYNMSKEPNDFAKLDLAPPEKIRIIGAVKTMDITGGHWSIRHLEGMVALISAEIARRYETPLTGSTN